MYICTRAYGMHLHNMCMKHLVIVHVSLMESIFWLPHERNKTSELYEFVSPKQLIVIRKPININIYLSLDYTHFMMTYYLWYIQKIPDRFLSPKRYHAKPRYYGRFRFYIRLFLGTAGITKQSSLTPHFRIWQIAQD